MAGYVWASIGLGALALLAFGYTLGYWPTWAYPWDSEKRVWALWFAALVVTLLATYHSAAFAVKAENYVPACLAEDGGPDLPCRWDGGVTENGLRQWIIYDRAE